MPRFKSNSSRIKARGMTSQMEILTMPTLTTLNSDETQDILRLRPMLGTCYEACLCSEIYRKGASPAVMKCSEMYFNKPSQSNSNSGFLDFKGAGFKMRHSSVSYARPLNTKKYTSSGIRTRDP